MNNVVSIFSSQRSVPYERYIDGLDRDDLLSEMVKFQQECEYNGGPNLSLMIRGIYLFGALEKVAESDALIALSRSYKNHLKYELENFRE